MTTTNVCNKVMSVEELNAYVNFVLDNELKEYDERDFESYQNVDHSLITPELVKEWAEGRSTVELADVAGYLQSEKSSEDCAAQQWHREPRESPFFTAMKPLWDIVNQRLKKEKLAKAKSALVKVPFLQLSYECSSKKALRYEYYTNCTLYLKDADTGEYIETTITDNGWYLDRSIDDVFDASQEYIQTVKGFYKKAADGYHLLFSTEGFGYDYYKIINDNLYMRIPYNGCYGILMGRKRRTQAFEEVMTLRF